MTTDNRTSAPTAEQIEVAMFQLFPLTVRYDGDDVPNPGAAEMRAGFKAGIEYMRGKQAEALEAFAERWATADGMEALMLATDAEVAFTAPAPPERNPLEMVVAQALWFSDMANKAITTHWNDLGGVGQEAYRNDAAGLLRAFELGGLALVPAHLLRVEEIPARA